MREEETKTKEIIKNKEFFTTYYSKDRSAGVPLRCEAESEEKAEMIFKEYIAEIETLKIKTKTNELQTTSTR